MTNIESVKRKKINDESKLRNTQFECSTSFHGFPPKWIQICNDPNWAAIGEEPLLAAVIVDFAPQWAEWAGKDNFDESFLAELM